LLVFLVLSACSDFDFIQLKYIYDIHALVISGKRDIDWEDVYRQSRNLGLSSVSYFSLKLAQDIFGTDIPKELLKRLKPGPLKFFILRMWINVGNILWKRVGIASSYAWRYFLSAYMLTSGVRSLLYVIYKKIFISYEELAAFKGVKPAGRFNAACFYLRRLLKPVYGVFNP
jgi:hypothetical protein